jgi:hypothetical protein
MKLFSASLFFLIMATPLFAQSGVVDKETLFVYGKAVVFFGPSQAEYLSLNDQEKDGIDETLYDFYHYRGKVLAFLKLNDIQEFSTAKLKIQVQSNGTESIIYYRKAFDHFVGLIMADGVHAPKVFLGAATDTDLIMMFEDYFGLY